MNPRSLAAMAAPRAQHRAGGSLGAPKRTPGYGVWAQRQCGQAGGRGGRKAAAGSWGRVGPRSRNRPAAGSRRTYGGNEGSGSPVGHSPKAKATRSPVARGARGGDPASGVGAHPCRNKTRERSKRSAATIEAAEPSKSSQQKNGRELIPAATELRQSG